MDVEPLVYSLDVLSGDLKEPTHFSVDKSRLMGCRCCGLLTEGTTEPLIAARPRPSTTEACICCKQVAEEPHGEHLKMYVGMYECMYVGRFQIGFYNLLLKVSETGVNSSFIRKIVF